MTKEQFETKMREFGYSDDFINEHLNMYDEAKENGVNIPFEASLIEPPIND